MNRRHALARCLHLGGGCAALVLAATAFGVGFDGIGDGRWALAGLAAAAALCWFDQPPVVGAATHAPRAWGGWLSTSGLLLTTALGAAWLGPRQTEEPTDEPPVEAWLRDDARGPDWPTLRVQGKPATRVVDEVGNAKSDGLGRIWTLTPGSALFLQLRHDPPMDEPFVGWAVPPAQIQVAGVPVARREGLAWASRLRTKHANRLSFEDGGPSIGRALAPERLTSPFPAGGTPSTYRIAKPYTRTALAWSTGRISIRAEAGHLIPARGQEKRVPPGAVPLVGINKGRNRQFMPLFPAIVDDHSQLVALHIPDADDPGSTDEPMNIDLLGEGQSETGPAILENWLREARSRSASAPGLVVVPQEIPWRRTFNGTEVVSSRGVPRPTPRPAETTSGWEIVAVVTAALSLVRFVLKDD